MQNIWHSLSTVKTTEKWCCFVWTAILNPNIHKNTVTINVSVINDKGWQNFDNCLVKWRKTSTTSCQLSKWCFIDNWFVIKSVVFIPDNAEERLNLNIANKSFSQLTCSSSELLPSMLTLFSEDVVHLWRAKPALEAVTFIKPISGAPPPLDQTALISADAK